MKKKILFIPYTFSAGGGSEKCLATLVNSLDLEKYEISIIEIEYFGLKKESLDPKIKLLPPIMLHFSNQFRRSVLLNILEIRPHIIRSYFNLDNYDVVIAWTHVLSPLLLSAFLDSNTVVWLHGVIGDWNISAKEKKVISLADEVVMISKHAFNSFEELFPNYTGGKSLIYNAFDAESCIEFAKEYINFDFIRNTFPVLIAVGRLDQNKNFSLIIRAVFELKSCGIKCNLLLIGIGEQMKELQLLSELLDVKDSVFFLGYKQNPMPYINHADILCLSSLSEGFPTVVCEAMALGKPFVTTPVSGSSDELSAGGLCGLVSTWDSKDYAEKIARLLRDKSLYNRMSHNCVEKIKEFSVDISVSSFDSLIQNMSPLKKRKTRTMPKIIAMIKLLLYSAPMIFVLLNNMLKKIVKAILPYGIVWLFQKKYRR
ncbi:glycosyltransferase [Treponema putidum]|uniref:Glycosyltransferase n=1 Tax=Treponema putidum TaxID=221027 RepID=A0ABY5HSF3_9SPIR|nr:glycosyltransferase [Treponema putidum]UTY28311.1 glycosyltransferase [Treponema putidum]